MLSQIAIMGIEVYRKYLSPLKGYKCASGVLGGKSTCSAVGLRIFKKTSLIKGMALLNRQFDKCALAAMELNARREQGVYKRLAPAGIRRSQGGFVDCGGCDAPGCDAPSCDLPSCEMPSCEVPSCEMPSLEMPSCEMPSLPRWGSCGASDAPSAGRIFDCLDVASYCDCSGCGNSSNTASGASGRSQLAKERKDQRDEERRKRREKRDGQEGSGSGMDGAADGEPEPDSTSGER